MRPGAFLNLLSAGSRLTIERHLLIRGVASRSVICWGVTEMQSRYKADEVLRVIHTIFDVLTSRCTSVINYLYWGW